MAVSVGDAASVRFSALSAKLTPLLDGHVTHVAADAIENSEKQNVYVSRITIEKLELTKLGEVDLVPGMPVEVLIRKGDRTAISYLLDPLSSIIFRGMKE